MTNKSAFGRAPRFFQLSNTYALGIAVIKPIVTGRIAAPELGIPPPEPLTGDCQRLQDVTTIRRGVPVSEFDALAARGVFDKGKLYELIIPQRSLRARRSQGKRLSPQQSEVLRRIVRIVDQAVTVFGSEEKARS